MVLGVVGALTAGLIGVAAVPAAASFTAGLTLQVTSPGPPGQDVYISDQGNNRVVEVTPVGVQKTVGSGLSSPAQVAVDAAGDVFIADMDNNRVVKVTPSGAQSIVLDGLNEPAGVAVDGSGDVYVADTDNSRVLEVTPSGVVTTVVSGIAATSVAVDSAGDLYLADQGGNKVIEVTRSGGQSTVGTGLFGPYGVAVDGAANVLIGDTGKHRVLKVTPSGTQTTVGTGLKAPDGVAEDAAGDVFTADFGSSQVYEVTPAGTQTTVGSGLSDPYSVAVGPVGPTRSVARQPVTLAAYALPTGSQAPTGTVNFFSGSMLLGTATLTETATGVDQATFTTTALTGGDDMITARYSGDVDYAGLNAKAQVDVQLLTSGLTLQTTSPAPPAQNLYVADTGNNRVLELTPSGAESTVGTGLSSPMGVATDAAGDVFIADTGNNRVLEVTSGTQTPIGTGLSVPYGVATDAAGDVFIADTGNNRVVEVTPSGVQTTLATDAGEPTAVVADAAGDVFVAEADNNAVVEITPSGAQTTVSTEFAPAGTPQGVATDSGGDVFVSYTSNNQIVEVTPSGATTTVLSSGLNMPEGVAVDAGGNAYIADTDNDRIVKVTRTGSQSDIGSGLSSPADVAVGPVSQVPARYGQAVTLSADAFPAGAGPPTGQVRFSVASTVLGTVTLAETPSGADRATLKTTNLPAGIDTVKATYIGDSTYTASSATAELEVSLALGPKTLTPAIVGTVYSSALTAQGGAAPYTFTRTAGTLPPGVHLSSSGTLSGKPTASGTFSFTVEAIDSANPENTGQHRYTLIVQSEQFRFAWY